VIVKPSMEDASVGIDEGSVCRTEEELRVRLAKVTAQWEDVLVQEYVGGREFNVGFVGAQVLPVSEIDFTGLPDGNWPIVTYAAKWVPGSVYDQHTIPICPARVTPALESQLIEVARIAWTAMAKCEGYGRVDIRLDDAGRPWVLEVNPDPDLSSEPDRPQAYLADRQTCDAWSRGAGAARALARALSGRDHVTARPLGQFEGSRPPAGRSGIPGRSPGDEVPVALGVFDAAVAGSPDYEALGVEAEGSRRWILPTPCTLGTWDLYWMAVDPARQGLGLGTALVEEMERRIAGRARLVIVETAGRPDYAATRGFYEARGYRAVRRIPDFYAPGDDQVTYVKYFALPAES
jgi:ribosomal protein S18 acetylase RimI-like enzyme